MRSKCDKRYINLIMITLTAEQLTEIKAYLNEVPFKYALPLFQYLDKLEQDAKPQTSTTVEAN
jgi:hypothetical protein